MFTYPPIDANKTVRFLRLTLRQIKPGLPGSIDVNDDFQQDWGLNAQDLDQFLALLEAHYMIRFPRENASSTFRSIRTTLAYLLSRTEAAMEEAYC